MTDRPGALTEERRRTHGEWPRTSRITRQLKAYVDEEITRAGMPSALNYEQREALDMILAKIARIVSGDPNHADHWHDIAGYAQLALGPEKPA